MNNRLFAVTPVENPTHDYVVEGWGVLSCSSAGEGKIEIIKFADDGEHISGKDLIMIGELLNNGMELPGHKHAEAMQAIMNSENITPESLQGARHIIFGGDRVVEKKVFGPVQWTINGPSRSLQQGMLVGFFCPCLNWSYAQRLWKLDLSYMHQMFTTDAVEGDRIAIFE